MNDYAAHGVGTAGPCVVHGDHRPISHINEVHHVWPLGDGGPDIPENKIVVCATGHNTIHQLINMARVRGCVPVLAGYAHKEFKLAALGWDRIQQQAM